MKRRYRTRDAFEDATLGTAALIGILAAGVLGYLWDHWHGDP
jgi:hypothetical protein